MDLGVRVEGGIVVEVGRAIVSRCSASDLGVGLRVHVEVRIGVRGRVGVGIRVSVSVRVRVKVRTRARGSEQRHTPVLVHRCGGG